MYSSSLEYDDETSLGLDWINKLFEPENLRHSWSWTLFFILIHSIVFFVGIVGNVVVFILFCRRRQMRNVTNIFLVNLAVADLFVILFCVPVNLMSNIFIPWILGTFMCKSVTYIQGISVFASAFSLTIVTMERCKGMSRFVPMLNHITKLKAVLIITFIWAAAFVILLPWPIVFELTIIPDNPSPLYCIGSWSSDHVGKIYFLFGNLLFCYVIPGFLISITNSHLWWQVSNQTVQAESASLTIHDHGLKLCLKKLLSLVTFTFLISWFPLYVVICKAKFTSVESMSDFEFNVMSVVIPIFQSFGCLNSCVNPLVNVSMNFRFQQIFTSVFHISNDCALADHQKYAQSMNWQVFVDQHSRGNASSCTNYTMCYSAQINNHPSCSSISQTFRECSCQDATPVVWVGRPGSLNDDETANKTEQLHF